MLVEEFAAYGLLMILTPLVTLVAWSLWTGRRLRFGTAPHVVARQFSTAQLLLITTEAAALLALGRVVLRWNRNAADEFWMGLTYNGPEGLFPVFLGVTLLPVVYFGLVRNRTWGGGLLLALYIIASTLSLAWVRIFNSWGNFVPETADDWWSNLLLQWLDFFWADVSAAATILVTFWLLRRIGYDFRRRDDGPLGRNSSNARNSAASASA